MPSTYNQHKNGITCEQHNSVDKVGTQMNVNDGLNVENLNMHYPTSPKSESEPKPEESNGTLFFNSSDKAEAATAVVHTQGECWNCYHPIVEDSIDDEDEMGDRKTGKGRTWFRFV